MASSDELLGESGRFITGLMFLSGKILESFDNQSEQKSVGDLIVAINAG
jgi:hypothetical protein